MPEERVHITPVKVIMRCGLCGRGQMISTGVMFTMDPPMHEHKCDECMSVTNENRVYPDIRFEEDPIEPFTSTTCTCSYDESDEMTNHAFNCPVRF